MPGPSLPWCPFSRQQGQGPTSLGALQEPRLLGTWGRQLPAVSPSLPLLTPCPRELATRTGTSPSSSGGPHPPAAGAARMGTAGTGATQPGQGWEAQGEPGRRGEGSGAESPEALPGDGSAIVSPPRVRPRPLGRVQPGRSPMGGFGAPSASSLGSRSAHGAASRAAKKTPPRAKKSTRRALPFPCVLPAGAVNRHKKMPQIFHPRAPGAGWHPRWLWGQGRAGCGGAGAGPGRVSQRDAELPGAEPGRPHCSAAPGRDARHRDTVSCPLRGQSPRDSGQSRCSGACGSIPTSRVGCCHETFRQRLDFQPAGVEEMMRGTCGGRKRLAGLRGRAGCRAALRSCSLRPAGPGQRAASRRGVTPTMRNSLAERN